MDAARILWNYHLMHHSLKQSDAILTLGSHDLRVAERAASLYLEGYAPLIVMSGGLGNLTRDIWTESEADKFAGIAVKMGVPPNRILIENRSTNTGENIQFSRELLQKKGIPVNSLIVVQKPYMERRSYATIRKQWPEPEVLVTSPQIPFEDYPNTDIPLERVVQIMVGDLQRIITYPDKGFQIKQEIPAIVMQAYLLLIDKGYNQHLAK